MIVIRLQIAEESFGMDRSENINSKKAENIVSESIYLSESFKSGAKMGQINIPIYEI